MSNTLRVRARGTALVPNFGRAELGTRAFIGRKFIATTVDGVERHGWESTDEVEEVPFQAEYVKAIADGDLWPADEATAKAAGVKFDATFGGASALKKLPAPQTPPVTTDKPGAQTPEKG